MELFQSHSGKNGSHSGIPNLAISRGIVRPPLTFDPPGSIQVKKSVTPS